MLPQATLEEYIALKRSIQLEGQHYPITVNAEYEILDGHHRNRVCSELGIEAKFEVKTFPNKLLEKKFVIESNLRRRQLNDYQKALLGKPLIEIEAELAKQRQESTLPQEGEKGFKSVLPPKEGNINRHDREAKAIVAKEIGLSTTTFNRALTIIEKADENLKKRVTEGKTSITHAYNIITTKEKHTEPQPLPQGTYNIIYADPPWDYEFEKRGGILGHYESLPLEKICNLIIPSAENAILFLWATNPKLKEALQVMQAWGFTYKTNLAWIKDKIGTGYYFRGQHELLLVGTKGAIGVPEEQNRPSSVLNAPRTEHSEKPLEAYTLIEKMYPNGKYLELFARNKRENWQSWGNQI